MGSVGTPEILLILVIALLLFGPQKLPELGKSLGRAIREFKKASTELQETIEREVEDVKRTAREDPRAPASSETGLPTGALPPPSAPMPAPPAPEKPPESVPPPPVEPR